MDTRKHDHSIGRKERRKIKSRRNKEKAWGKKGGRKKLKFRVNHDKSQ